MIYINDIPYLKVFKKKVSLPKDSSSILKNNVVIINSLDISDTISLYNHPMINKPTNYTMYYIDPIYKEKISNKTVNINYRTQRKDIYKSISDKGTNTTLKGINTIELANSRNLIYDLFPYNDIYYKNYKPRGNVKIRITNYIEFIASKINKPILSTEYKTKTLIMDIDSWIENPTKLSTSKKTVTTNPILMISYAMYKFPEVLSVLGNIDIVFYSKTGIIKINPSMLDDKSYNLYKREMNKLLTKITIDTIEAVDEEEDTEEDSVEDVDNNAKDTVPKGPSKEIPRAEDAKKIYANNDNETLITSAETDEKEEEEREELENINDEDDTPPPPVDNTTSDEYGDILSSMTEITHSRRKERSPESIARDKVLKERQETLVVKGKTIKDHVTYKKEDFYIPEKDVSSKVKTTNENMTTIKFANFNKSYNEKVMTKDTVNMITHINNLSIPTYVKDIKVEDTSTELDYKETYTVVLEDSNRVRHTLKFDMPKFIDNDYMYIGGNRKIISKQMAMKPLVKTGPDEVQIVSNYNKIFVYRIGRKMTAQLEKFKKALANDIKGIKVTYGDSLKANRIYKTVLVYDELAKSIYSIKNKDIEIIMNQHDVTNRLGDKAIPNNHFCVGFYSDGSPIFMDLTTEKIGNDDLITFIINSLGDDVKVLYDESSAGASKFMYTSAKIMNKLVPVIILLGYCEGLTTVMKKAKINHHFTDKRPTASDTEGVIQFADGYLVFDRYPFENSLLLNALAYIPTKAYPYAAFDDIDVYMDLFDALYGARQLANAFDSFYEFMIDPITKEILTDLGYPTDFVSVVLCANYMLVDNSYRIENDMNIYRIRSNEVVNAVLYKQIANAYSRYRATSGNKNPVKISIPRNAVISELMKINTVEDYSTLNPLYEMTKTRIASPRGANGMNLDEAYTLTRRFYDKSMIGIIGVSSSPDFNVGMSRHLTLEPQVNSARGYVDIKDTKDLTDANMLTAAELLTPGGVLHDDAPRVAMASKQSTHIVPIDKASPVLISNGSEQIIQHHLSSDFAVVAEEDGEVVERNDKSGLIVVKYKSGKYRAIDINPRIGKNAASGFYVSNKLKSNLQVGDKVKANDIMAYEEKFFSEDEINGNRMNIGSLQKVAIASAYATFEDSSFITKKVSTDMGTSVIMMKDTTIGKNADVDHIVNIGDTVEVGDPLISFSTSYDDERMNEFLRTISAEQGEEVKDLSRTQLKSKYGGVIEDIKIYSSVDLNELSPSLKSIVSKYYQRINQKKNILNKYDKNDSVVKAGVLLNEPTKKVPTSADGKIKGHDVDGVLIEFYIKYHDVVGVGDKITFFSALKSVVCETIEEGYEPFSEFRPEEEVSAFVPPLSIIGRMVPSTIQTIMCNKILVELKRHLKDIYEK